MLIQLLKLNKCSIQVSPFSTNPELSNKNRFAYFFRTVSPDNYQAAAIVRLLVEQGWRYVSVVYEDDFYGVQGFRGTLLV